MMAKPPLSKAVFMQVGDALTVADIDGAITALSQARGTLIPPVADADESDTPDADASDAAPRKRKRRRKSAPLDPSGYPRIASLSARAVRALVSAVWARCHGKAIRSTGILAPLRELKRRELVDVAPKSVSGDRVAWYVATQLGALVILKALMRGSPAVTKALAELRA